jgi:ethanolamine utilization protein EutN
MGVILVLIGKVVGTVISTRKNPNLVGNKFLIIEPYEGFECKGSGRIVAVDNVGSGIGDLVLVATGSAARIGCDMNNAPIDAAVVGIVDDAKDVIISRQ